MRKDKKYGGLYVPVITPFRNGQIDEDGFLKVLDHFLDKKVEGLVIAGTTGESSTLSIPEHEQLIETAVRRIDGRLKVIAGTGSNSTAEAVCLTRYADSVGVDACLVVSPYYNRPSQEGLFNYFKTVAESVQCDILIYNIPSRTCCNVSVEVVKRLARIPNIKGIKEGAGDIQQMIELGYYFADTDFAVLTGEDSLLYTCLSVGGDGGVMASATVIPRELAEIVALFKAGCVEEARCEEARLRPLVQALFAEVNPVPCKFALSEILALSDEVRPPLIRASEGTRQLLRREIQRVISLQE